MSDTKRLVSVRRVTLAMPIMGHPDKVLLTVDSYQVPVAKSLKIRQGDLVFLFRANTFLPAKPDEFEDFGPQNEYNGERGFIIRPSPPLLINGKPKTGLFPGMIKPLDAFPVIAAHIRDNMNTFSSNEALLNALRNTSTFQTFLDVREYHVAPPDNGGYGALSLQNSSTPNTPISQTDGTGASPTDSLFGMRPLPSLKSKSNSSGHDIIGFRPHFATKLDMINAEDITSLFYGGKAATTYAVTTFMVGSPISIYFVRANSKHLSAVKRARKLPRSGGKMGVCSRTLDLSPGNPMYPRHWAAVEAAGLPAALDDFDRSVVIHGVLVGDGIRDNYEGLEAGRIEIFAYAIVDIDAPNDNTLSVGRMAPTGPTTWRLLNERLGLKTVPQQEDCVTLKALADDHEGLAELADGPGWFVEKRAGLVFRNTNTGRAFKVMSRAYVDRYGEPSIRNETQKAKWHKLE